MTCADIRPAEEGSPDMEGIDGDMKLIRCQNGTLSVASGRSTGWTSAPGGQRILELSRDRDVNRNGR
jgi:hypothetical protein